MSGMRDHEIYIFEAEGIINYYNRDADGDIVGDRQERPHTLEYVVIASNEEVARGYFFYWAQHQPWKERPKLTLKKKYKIDAFHQTHIW